MKLTHDYSTATVTRSATLTDGPVLPHPYLSGKQTVPVRLTVTYELQDGQWHVKPGGLSYIGAIIKADGTPGKKTISATPIYDWKRDPQWTFLHWAIDVLRPVGGIHMPDGTHTPA